MLILHDPAEMQAWALSRRAAGRRVVFVPTMGALHEGHLSLIRRGRDLGDDVVVSLFVNPTQFGPGEDLDRYPRHPERDAALCQAEDVDVLFRPAAEAIYPPGDSTTVGESEVTRGLEGACRPGHFQGVLTVVAKLFLLVQPAVAVFGQKDGQQLAAVRRMVRDLHMPVRVVGAPTIREEDGLALSSRNVYLSPEDRLRATCLWRAICAARARRAEGGAGAEDLRRAMRSVLESEAGVRIDYAEVVDGETFCPVDPPGSKARLALAVHVGGTRLIDNASLDPAVDAAAALAQG